MIETVVAPPPESRSGGPINPFLVHSSTLSRPGSAASIHNGSAGGGAGGGGGGGVDGGGGGGSAALGLRKRNAAQTKSQAVLLFDAPHAAGDGEHHQSRITSSTLSLSAGGGGGGANLGVNGGGGGGGVLGSASFLHNGSTSAMTSNGGAVCLDEHGQFVTAEVQRLRTEAALKIQSVYRGHLGRKKVNLENFRRQKGRAHGTPVHSAVKIQSWWRSILARRTVAAKRLQEHKAERLRQRNGSDDAGGGASGGGKGEMITLRDVFEYMDSSHSGYVGAEKLHTVLADHDVDTNVASVAEIIWEVDDDNDGFFSYDDLKRTYLACIDDPKGSEPRRLFAIAQFLLNNPMTANHVCPPIPLHKAILLIQKCRCAHGLKRSEIQRFFNPQKNGVITMADFITGTTQFKSYLDNRPPTRYQAPRPSTSRNRRDGRAPSRSPPRRSKTAGAGRRKGRGAGRSSGDRNADEGGGSGGRGGGAPAIYMPSRELVSRGVYSS